MKVLFSLVSLLCFLVISCSTAPPMPVINEPLVYRLADLTITLKYLDKDTLVSRHGRNFVSDSYVNPFYGFPGAITKVRLISFEFEATTSESEVVFHLDEISLRVASIGGTAKSKEYIRRIWSHYQESDIDEMNKTLLRTILPREFTVTPDKPVKGYLVFGENYPDTGGKSLISMYIRTPDGDEGIIEIPMQFTRDGLGKIRENSGIFDQEAEKIESEAKDDS